MINTIQKKQPSQLYILAVIMSCERFSFYGMRLLMIFYLTEVHNMSDGDAKEIAGAFSSLFTSVQFFGGFITDRWLGSRISVFVGLFLMTIGHLIISIDSFEFFSHGLGVLVCAAMFMRVPILALAGECYKEDDPRRTIGFTLFYSLFNIGAIASNLIGEKVARTFGWHYGFGLAAVVMVIGFVTYVWTRKLFVNIGKPKVPLKIRHFLILALAVIVLSKGFSMLMLSDIYGYVSTAILVIALLTFFVIVFFFVHKNQRSAMMKIGFITLVCFVGFTILDQLEYSVPLFSRRNVDRIVSFSFMGNNFSYELEANMFQAMNPGIVLLAGPAIALLWRKLQKRDIIVRDTMKIMIGLFIAGASYTLFYFCTFAADETAKVHYSYLLLIIALVSSAEVFLQPVAYSVITNEAPVLYRTIIFGLFKVGIGLADYAASQLSKLTDVDKGDRLNTFVSLKIYQEGFLETDIIFSVIIAVLLVTGFFLNKKFKTGT